MAGLTVPEEVQKQINSYLKQKGYDSQYCVLYYDYWDCDFAIIQLKDGLVDVVPLGDELNEVEIIINWLDTGNDTILWVVEDDYGWYAVVHTGKEVRIYKVESLVDMVLKGLENYTPIEVIELT